MCVFLLSMDQPTPRPNTFHENSKPASGRTPGINHSLNQIILFDVFCVLLACIDQTCFPLARRRDTLQRESKSWTLLSLQRKQGGNSAGNSNTADSNTGSKRGR